MKTARQQQRTALLQRYLESSHQNVPTAMFQITSVLFAIILLLLQAETPNGFNSAGNNRCSHIKRTIQMVPTARDEECSKEDADAYNVMVSKSVDLSDAHVSHGVLTVNRSVRDIDCNQRRNFLCSIPVDFSSISIPPSELASNIKARIPSPSGGKLAVYKEESVEGTGDTRQVVEIWIQDCQSLSRRVVLPGDLHGKVCNDPGWFGSMTWNQQENAIVYSAERKIPPTSSFFSQEKKEEESSGGQFTLGLGKTETWGEKYTNLAPLLDLYCLDITTGNVGQVKNVPGAEKQPSTTNGGFVLGQAVFDPSGRYIVYTGWDAGSGMEMPKRLGMIYCFQRPCKLYASPVNKLFDDLAQATNDKEMNKSKHEDREEGFICLTQDARLSRSPVFGPTISGKSKLAFLSRKEGHDTHGAAVTLCVLDWSVKNGGLDLVDYKNLVGLVDMPASDGFQVAGLGFPGLYFGKLPSPCFNEDGKFIFLTTQWGSVQKIVRVSVSDGTVTPLDIQINPSDGSPKNGDASQSLLCITKNGGLVMSNSSPNQAACIGYISQKYLAAEDLSQKLVGQLLSKMPSIAASSFSSVSSDALSNQETFTSEVLSLQAAQVPGVVDSIIQCILLCPKNVEKPPLIVVPHGGPHGCSSTTFIPSYAFLCSQGGYAILHVNYRGSTGFGEGPLNSLPGNIGEVDVKDMVEATKTVCKSGKVDPTRVGICGGSHGGFLTGHLIGQYPNLFKVAAMRNPVTNIASMVTSTDIPDWCYVEALGSGKYDWKEYRGPTEQELDSMWKASPIAHVKNAVAPTLVALGMSDQRVPPSQGLEYFYTLRSKGVKTKLLMYEKDDHAIDGVVSEADHWINIKQWFDEHL